MKKLYMLFSSLVVVFALVSVSFGAENEESAKS